MPPGSYRPGDSRSRPPRSSHLDRDRDRREDSPRQRQRDNDHYEPRKYRDRRRSPDTRPRYRDHHNHQHHAEKQKQKQNQNQNQNPNSNDDASTENRPPRPKLYSRTEIKRDEAAYNKVRAVIPRGLPPRERERAKSLPSANELKTKIRDLKRLLSHADAEEGMPADQRVEKERALAGYQRDLEEVEERKKRSEMISKYHFVRFLERKRATNNLNKALKHEHSLQHTKDPSPTHDSDLKQAAQQVHEARVSLNYTIYFPLTEKYISLYPNAGKPQNKDDHNNKRERERERERDRNEDVDSHPDSMMLRNQSGEKPPLWGLVERCMLEDEREAAAAGGDGDDMIIDDNEVGAGSRRRLEELRDGKLGIGFAGANLMEESAGAGAGAAGMSIPVVGGKKPGTFGVGPDSSSSSSKRKNKMKKQQQQQPQQQRSKKPEPAATAGGDVKMKDEDGESSDGGFFE